jgi:hypothetical protein
MVHDQWVTRVRGMGADVVPRCPGVRGGLTSRASGAQSQ